MSGPSGAARSMSATTEATSSATDSAATSAGRSARPGRLTASAGRGRSGSRRSQKRAVVPPPCTSTTSWWRTAGRGLHDGGGYRRRTSAPAPDAGPGGTMRGMTEDQKSAEPTPEERMEVQRTIPAEPSRIFALLSDPQGHVTIDSSGMLMDATGEPATKVGDEFRRTLARFDSTPPRRLPPSERERRRAYRRPGPVRSALPLCPERRAPSPRMRSETGCRGPMATPLLCSRPLTASSAGVRPG